MSHFRVWMQVEEVGAALIVGQVVRECMRCESLEGSRHAVPPVEATKFLDQELAHFERQHTCLRNRR